jgi:hypothetical protein
VVRDLVRHRAEEEPLGAGHALVADDDQVRAVRLRDIDDRVGRVAGLRVRVNLQVALVLGRDLLEVGLGVLGRPDRVGDVVGDAGAL